MSVLKDTQPIRRIHIIGASGSGKTTLGKQLSRAIKIPVYDLDDLQWLQKYDVMRPKMERIKMLKKITAKKRWITEGTGTSWTHDAVRNADLVIELRKVRPVLLWRVFRRTVNRKFSSDAPKETIKNIWELCKYVWVYRDPNKIHRQQHDALMLEVGGKHLVIKNKKDIKQLLERISSQQP